METKTKFILFFTWLLAITVSVSMSLAISHKTFEKKQLTTDLEAVTDDSVVLAPANLYQCTITKNDSLQTEYSVYVYAADKWDAQKEAENNYLVNESVGSMLSVIRIKPTNKYFECPESMLEKERTQMPETNENDSAEIQPVQLE